MRLSLPDQIGLPPVLSRRCLALAAVALAAAGVVAFAIDLPLLRWMGPSAGRIPRDLIELVDLAEVFGHGAGIFLILLGVWWLDASRRKRLAGVVGLLLATGFCVHVLKRIACRVRPYALKDGAATVWDTFAGWSAWHERGWEVLFDRNLHSWPSGHAAFAFAFACGLAALYPRGTGYFFLLAALASLQRVLAQAHFPSDVLFGAAVAMAVAAWWPRRVACDQPDSQRSR